jgi:hypothetical protein
MNYELAKELKDAGFPIKGHSEDHDGGFCYICYATSEQLQQPCVPTLSELIEECGIFRVLELQSKENSAWYAGAGSWSDAFGYEFAGRGVTPEEAVARLWLALNKK